DALPISDDWSTPESIYAATLRSFPTSYAALYGLGGLRLEEGTAASARGDAAAAADALDEAARLFDAAAEAAAGDAGREVDARFGRGRALVVRGDFEAAVSVLREVDRALAASPDLARTSRHAAEARFQLGLALSQVPRLAEAEEVFRRLIEIHGETARRLDAYGEVLRARRDGRALTQYDRALAIDPDHHPARIHLAEMLRAQEGYEGLARQQLKEVLARDPSNRRARELLEAWTRGDSP
ncbi:MAG: hypothetical protein ACF8XB_11845, partial [Planctomycetota bacterium JB042]